MKRSSTLILGLVLALLAGPAPLAAAPGPHGRAPQQGKAFRAVWQAALPAPIPLQETDTWGGSIYASLDGEFLLGGIAGNDGTEFDYPTHSIFNNGRYTICFAASVQLGWGGASDCTDSFTFTVPRAFVTWPGSDALGSYKAVANIVEGTGKFASAKGYLEISIPFILWTPDGENWQGRGSGVISGMITGVE